MGESAESRVDMSGGGMAHRGRLLVKGADAATRQTPFDGLATNSVVLQAVTERSQEGYGSESTGVSMGADRKAKTWELVRAPSSLLQ